MAAMGEPAGAGNALSRDGDAEDRGGPRRRQPADARAPGAMETGRARPAGAGRGHVASVQGGAGRGVRPHGCARRGAARGVTPRTWPRRSRCASRPRRFRVRATGCEPRRRFRRSRRNGSPSGRSCAGTSGPRGNGFAGRAIASSPAARTISSSARNSGRRIWPGKRRCAPGRKR